LTLIFAPIFFLAKHQASLAQAKLEKQLKEAQERAEGLRTRVEDVEKEKRERDQAIVSLEKKNRHADKERKQLEKELEAQGKELDCEKEKRRREEAKRREVERSIEPLKAQAAELQISLTRTQAESAVRLAALKRDKDELEAALTAQANEAKRELEDLRSRYTMLELQHTHAQNDLSKAKSAVANLEGAVEERERELVEARSRARKMRGEVMEMVAKVGFRFISINTRVVHPS
jgi:chromosome segregation ATPase